MANSGKRHTNTSQFFITLDRADELTNKHTVFGKVMGNTIYNVMSIGELDVDAEERPTKPPRVRGIRIIENPFDDIVPRITAAEKKAQALARAEAKREAEQREKKAKAKKNTGLLSFGGAEEVGEEQVIVRKKGISRQDLMDDTTAESSALSKKKRPAETFVDVPESLQGLASGSKESGQGEGRSKDKKAKVELKDIRAQHEAEKLGQTAAREAEIKRMTDSLRALKKASGQTSDSDSDDDAHRRKKTSHLQEELAKYAKNRGRAAKKVNRKGKRDEEDDILRAMERFSRKVKREAVEEEEEREREEERRREVVRREKEEMEAEERERKAQQQDDEEEEDWGIGQRRDEGDSGGVKRTKMAPQETEPPGREVGDGNVAGPGAEAGAERVDEAALEVDDDVAWMKHSLKFEVDEKELTRRAEEEYAVIDPRAKAKELAAQDRHERDGKRQQGMRTAGEVGRRR